MELEVCQGVERTLSGSVSSQLSEVEWRRVNPSGRKLLPSARTGLASWEVSLVAVSSSMYKVDLSVCSYVL